MPARELIWICLTPSRRYSTGSSTDTMLLSRVFTDEMSAYKVDDFPEPVGPVTKIAPCGAWNAVTKRSLSYSESPRLDRSMAPRTGSRSRSTTDSPAAVGTVAIRTSIGRPCTLSEKRPSWGRRFCAMSRLPMTLSRLTIGRKTLSGASDVSWRMPSIRIRIMTFFDAGSMWRSEARSATAFSSSALTSLTTGASSTSAPLLTSAWTS